MSITPLTIKRLFALSGNECAFPGCTSPVIDTEYGTAIGQICHIKGRSPGGPRYDPNQTEEERDGYDNLLVMCAAHNKIIDDPATRDDFSVEMLLGFKKAHEAKSRNTVVKEDLIERIVESLQRAMPATAQAAAPSLILHAAQKHYGREVVLSLSNEGRGSARAPYFSFQVPESYRISPYGIDGNNKPGFLGEPQGPDTYRAACFGGNAAHVIHSGVTVAICVLRFNGHDAESQLGGTLRIEYETAADGQEKKAGVATVMLGLEGG